MFRVTFVLALNGPRESEATKLCLEARLLGWRRAQNDDVRVEAHRCDILRLKVSS